MVGGSASGGCFANLVLRVALVSDCTLGEIMKGLHEKREIFQDDSNWLVRAKTRARREVRWMSVVASGAVGLMVTLHAVIIVVLSV